MSCASGFWKVQKLIRNKKLRDFGNQTLRKRNVPGNRFYDTMESGKNSRLRFFISLKNSAAGGGFCEIKKQKQKGGRGMKATIRELAKRSAGGRKRENGALFLVLFFLFFLIGAEFFINYKVKRTKR